MTPSQPSQTIVQTPNQPAPPPVFASDPQGKKPKAKSPFATFLGSGSTPALAAQQAASKTLLGA